MKIQELEIDHDGVFVNVNGIIDYSDGNKNEEYVYTTLKHSSDNSIFSPVLSSSIKNWSSEYHFSPYRCNILRPININQSWSVLEIGGGCGSITRYLGETGAEITSVEGSHNRAKCIRQRCKDLDNVTVVCSNVEDLEFDKKYDMITLIGVFEYTAKYSKKDNPYNEALKFYRSLLTPEGILVIAIENKLGLKYFSGFDEDHIGIPYYGIENQYKSKGVRTFGKDELSSMINKANFSEIEILYPFPDYKLPKITFTDKAFCNLTFNSVDLIRLTKNRHYSPKPKANLLNDELVWSSLHANNLISHFSNSFLFIAKNKQELRDKTIDSDLLAQFYACDRVEPWSTSTTFREKDDQIQVTKEMLVSNKNYINNNTTITQNLSHENVFIEGYNLHHFIKDSIKRKDYEEFNRLTKVYIDYLIANTIKELDSNDIGKSEIHSKYFDCLPSNLIVDKFNRLNVIDTEWTINMKLNLNFLIVRFLMNYRKVWGLSIGFPKSFKKLVNDTLINNNLKPISGYELKRIIILDNSIFNQIMLPGRITPLQLSKSILYLIRNKMAEMRFYITEKIIASR